MAKNQGRRNRQRGQEYEREIVDIFRLAGWPDARRNLQSQGGTVVGNDIAGVPFAVECKRTASSLIPKAVKALEQCDADATATENYHPRLVITRCDRDNRSFVVMELGQFLELVEPPLDLTEQCD